MPSRMTLGQIIESLFGKLCANHGMFGDCTAFQMKGLKYSMYEKNLVNAGFNSTGNEILYDGMNGKQISADIYIGVTYYMRLKHMVKDKINYRARGPRTNLTRQPVQGRANDGGLRIGEMERDGLLGHGMSYFLNESFLTRGDEYYIAVCNKSGAIAIYNENRNLFLSPFADGPIQFHTNPDNTMNIKNISQFGRSFSILKIPYSFKLLIQELQCMNIQMRIITDENIDNSLNMSYSKNINCLLNLDNDASYEDAMNEIDKIMLNKLQIPPVLITAEKEQNPYNDNMEIHPFENSKPTININIQTPDNSPPYAPNSPQYPEGVSPPYAPEEVASLEYPPKSPEGPPPYAEYSPKSPEGPPPYVEYSPKSPEGPPPIQSILDVEKSQANSNDSSNSNDSNNSSNSNNDNTKKIIALN
jgi:hypothetical protein